MTGERGIETAVGDARRSPSIFPKRWLKRGVELGDGADDDEVRAWIRCNMVEDGDPRNRVLWEGGQDLSPAALMRRVRELEAWEPPQ